MKVRRILLDEHNERLRREKCPRCKKWNLRKTNVSEVEALPGTKKYKLVDDFWVCSGPSGIECYFMSGLSSTTLFESAECVDLVDFTQGYTQPSTTKIIRRRGGERFEITLAS